MNEPIRKFKISLTSGEVIFLEGLLQLIDVVDWFTHKKTTTFFELDKETPTTIFRKHIVKISEVK